MLRNSHIKVLIPGLLLAFIVNILPFEGIQAQSKGSKFKAGCPEKWWAIGHPFVAKKAFRITKESLSVTDSIKESAMLAGTGSGDQVDAFKHAFWMALLAQETNPKKALKLGNAHEKANYKSFKKCKRKGIPNRQDKASSEMDLWNNRLGSEIARSNSEAGKDELIQLIIEAIRSGQMRIIKVNHSGDYLDEDGELIPSTSLKGVWDNGKVLVPSDQ